MRIDAIKDLLARYRAVFMAAWRERDGLKPPPRSKLEREFLPAALELQESPLNPLNRVLLHFIVFVFAAFLVWSIVGRVDTVAVATGKIIPSTRTQIIQPIETASVRRIHVVDGQRVEAGTLLLELDSTTPDAAVLQAREMWDAERLRAARNRALLAAIEHAGPSSRTTTPPRSKPSSKTATSASSSPASPPRSRSKPFPSPATAPSPEKSPSSPATPSPTNSAASSSPSASASKPHPSSSTNARSTSPRAWQSPQK